MRHTPASRIALALLLAVLTLSAQQPTPPPPSGVPATVLRVTTRLVLVDVVVTDKNGNALTDLTRDDFELLENGKERAHAEHASGSPPCGCG